MTDSGPVRLARSEWRHHFTDKRTLRLPDGTRQRIFVEAGLHDLPGNARPYFSVTGLITERFETVAGGCLHEEIAKTWPELAPVITVHLSDEFGYPMHAVANGAYWLGFTAYPDARSLSTFAKQWRVSIEDAEAIESRVLAAMDAVDSISGDVFTTYRARQLAAAREEVDIIADEMAEQWLADADAARAALDHLIGASS